jgi:hypothetical protein
MSLMHFSLEMIPYQLSIAQYCMYGTVRGNECWLGQGVGLSP